MTGVHVDDDHARLVSAVSRHSRDDGTVNYTALGKEFGLHRSNIKKRVSKLARAGALGFDPVIPSFAINRVTTQLDADGEVKSESIRQSPAGAYTAPVRDGFAIARISTLRDASRMTTQEWTIQKPASESPEHIAEVIKASMAEYVPPPRSWSPMPDSPLEDALAFYPLADMHFGLYAWRAETDENWDLKIAEDRVGKAFTKLVRQTPRTKHAVVLGGGDQMHADNNENKTSRSNNSLQVDGRYDKVLGATNRFFCTAIDLALQNHEHVTVRVLKGNHDEHASVAVAYHTLAWYRHEPRVTVDVDPSLFWWFPFGKTFLGATHGHTVKPKQMPMIMATRRKENWGQSDHRFIHTFHVHHDELRASEGDGVITETHQAPIPQDAWHFGAGFLSGRSLKSIVYDRNDGEISRVKVPVRRAA